MENNEVKEIKLVRGYDYHIHNTYMKQEVLFELLRKTKLKIDHFYKSWIEKFKFEKDRHEKAFLNILYITGNYFVNNEFIKMDTAKMYFDCLFDYEMDIIVAKAKDNGTMIVYSDEWNKKPEIKDRIFEGQALIKLSDKLLEQYGG